MGINRIRDELCTGCGTCVEICPMDVLRMDVEKGKAFIKYIQDCQSCFLCERDCPEEAIRVIPFFERRIPIAW